MFVLIIFVTIIPTNIFIVIVISYLTSVNIIKPKIPMLGVRSQDLWFDCLMLEVRITYC